MKFYDIELVDKDTNTENFKFTKVSEASLNDIKKAFKDDYKFIEFSSKEGTSFLETSFFRGMFYNAHDTSTNRNTLKETLENSVEISKLKK